MGFDTELLEEEFGPSSDIEKLKGPVFIKNPKNVSASTPAVDRCIENELIGEYGDIVTGAFVGIFFDYLWEGNYTLAAKYLIKIGVKGSVLGIAVELTSIAGKCVWQEEGW
ncbi:hypothetical protein P9E76_12620 [Schinkia azotoformans]|uniref:Uncharacterized protein n=1 Tax=Schinkia azotoformans LMG 9581 TaxID=1131731 RepID=K6CS11_SCHAZ|nr:hypothetical protein [Schinkia azotoformans]EKN63012.1 hypothetical protein BAZO_19668 [Schinkia azotoformans LMG 9581]MEC1639301.1 hypothetical protein [Schinkia azotoformans]MEC1719471.1 hypothetical protein [Schinkia azotoformans]MEC1945888.1 hypothetical protein [Schinkia azotoformans]MED4351239.1 hypothetical protein [Schinkia azotoformans]